MIEWVAGIRDGLRPLVEASRVLLPPDSPAAQMAIAGCALLLIALLARTPVRWAPVRHFHLLAAGLAVFALLLALAGLLPDSFWLSVIVWPVSLLLAGGLLGKLALASRFAALRDARHDPRGRVDSRLLPFQRRALGKLLEQASLAPTPQVLGLQASWGAGKSMLMEHLVRSLDLYPNRYVAVRLNVWEHEDYNDLQFGIMQALMAHPRVLEGYGWMDFPLWMLVREWGGLRFRHFRFGWGQNEADADGSLRLPWQNRLERLVARQHLAGRRVVVVLDEVDRASASATQSVLTLLTRSLALPGVVAVVPFVENVIRYKAFHPDQVMLDDLRDTVSAYLHEAWREREGVNDQDAAGPRDPRRTFSGSNASGFAILSDRFAHEASATAWAEYFVRMEEKYLRQRIYLGRLEVDDVLELLQLPEIRVGFVAGFGEAQFDALLAWVETQRGDTQSPLSKIETTVRWLKGDLLKLLSPPSASGLDPRFLLVLALAMGR
jgi:hypothetical protein